MDVATQYQDVFHSLAQLGYKNVARRTAKLPKSHRTVANVIEMFSDEEADFLNLHFLRTRATPGRGAPNTLPVVDQNALIATANKTMVLLDQRPTKFPGPASTSSGSHTRSSSASTPPATTPPSPSQTVALLRRLLQFMVTVADIRIHEKAILLNLLQKHNGAPIDIYQETLAHGMESVAVYCQDEVVGHYAQAVHHELQVLHRLLEFNDRVRHYDFFSSVVAMQLHKNELSAWRRICLPSQTEGRQDEPAEPSTFFSLWNSLSGSIYPGRSIYSYPPLFQWISHFFKALCGKMTIYFEQQLAEREANLPHGDLRAHWRRLESRTKKGLTQFRKRALPETVAVVHLNDEVRRDPALGVHDFGFQLQTKSRSNPETHVITDLVHVPEPLSEHQLLFVTSTLQNHQEVLDSGYQDSTKLPVVVRNSAYQMVYWIANLDGSVKNYLVAVFKEPAMKMVRDANRLDCWHDLVAELRLTRAFESIVGFSI
ncbi:hypothetical protein H4R35_005712 [Dimargaris xerosporica]|nr:hypothetical protein H4R35_005712 [Dimargaris xerosporica]